MKHVKNYKNDSLAKVNKYMLMDNSLVRSTICNTLLYRQYWLKPVYNLQYIALPAVLAQIPEFVFHWMHINVLFPSIPNLWVCDKKFSRLKDIMETRTDKTFLREYIMLMHHKTLLNAQTKVESYFTFNFVSAISQMWHWIMEKIINQKINSFGTSNFFIK
jgi:hypothetical protein